MQIVSKPTLPGVPVVIGGHTLLVPSLSLRQFKEHYLTLTAQPENESLLDQIERVLPVMLTAINRNYPEVSADDLRENLELATFRDVLLTVQGASGLKPVAPGE